MKPRTLDRYRGIEWNRDFHKPSILSFRIVHLVAVLVVLPSAVAGQTTPMELNRSGRWTEAAAVAEALLEESAEVHPTRRCELLAQLIYARSQAGIGDLEASIALFDMECSSVPEGHWTRAEVDRFRIDPNRLADSVAERSVVADSGWPTAEPESHGLNPAALAEHRDLCMKSGADACLVAHQGSLVQEWYGVRYRDPMYTMSSMKSWTGLLVGMLLSDGQLQSIDEPVSHYIPEWRAGAEAGVTIRHLLTMTAGLRTRNAPGESHVGSVAEKNTFVFSLPLDFSPGERWAYSNEGVQLLSPILERAAGIPLEDYAKARLFRPLGMESTALNLDAAGNAWTYADARTTLRDFAKVCQLMLQGGRWTDVQVVPEEWVRQSIEPTAENSSYGLLWWVFPGGFAAQGYLDTSCYVLPELELVVARMQSRPDPNATKA